MKSKLSIKDFESNADSLSKEPAISALNKVDTHFNQTIYDDLPGILKEGCDILLDRVEKEVFLLGGIGVIGGILPNVTGFYDNKLYGPQLYIYILGKYGSGKGSLPFSKYLGAEIHAEKASLYDREMAEYKTALLDYQKNVKDYLGRKSNGVDAPEEPIEPKRTMLFIPANTSKTGMFELLANNQGVGVIFETEGDSMANTLKQDYGNYSEGLRNAFHHETISYYRRGGKEYAEIENPQLGVILTSTFDQFRKLIPNPQNGLFSRFMYYQLESGNEFKNVFDPNKKSYPDFFRNLGVRMKEIYDVLNQMDGVISFDFTNAQKKIFWNRFSDMKKEIRNFHSEDLDGTIHRLALICFRISMIFTVLRSFENSVPNNEIFCSDVDLKMGIKLLTS